MKKISIYFTSLIEEALKNFEPHITRIEVHLSDENGKKEGLNDIGVYWKPELKLATYSSFMSADTVELAVIRCHR